MGTFPLWILILFISNSKSRSDDLMRLTVLHSNDIRGNYASDADGCGGIPKTLHLIKTFKSRSKIGHPVIYLNVGDMFTGSVWFSVHRANIAANFVRLMKPDALALGSHEFDEGLEGLETYGNQINQLIVCSNVDLSAEPKFGHFIKKSVILKPNNSFCEIGIVGYINSKTTNLTKTGNITFQNAFESVKKEALKLKRKGVKIIIALGHSGIETDKNIAKNVPEVDMVIGGHYYSYGKPLTNDKIYGQYPLIIEKPNGVKVPLVQVAHKGKYLGKLDVQINSNGDVEDFKVNPIFLDKDIPEDIEALELLDQYRAPIQNLTNKTLATSRVFLQGGVYCRGQECNFGNLITDAIVQFIADKFRSTSSWTDTPIAIINSGLISSSINASNFERNVTEADLVSALPYRNEICTLTIKGSTLLEVLEHSVELIGESDLGEFLQVSGLKVTFDLSQRPRVRVVEVLVRCSKCDVPQFEKLRLNSTYKVAMNGFIADGKDGYGILKGIDDKENLGVTDFDVVKRYIVLSKVVKVNVENRITVRYNIQGDLRNGVCLRSNLRKIAIVFFFIVSKFAINL